MYMVKSKNTNNDLVKRGGDTPYVIDLIERSKQGDEEAFTEIVNLYQNKILFVVKRYVSEPAEVSDVCQEVYIKIYRYINSFKGDSTFYTWLYRVASSVAKNHLVHINKQSYITTSDEYNFTDYMDFAVDVHENSNPQEILVSDETLTELSQIIDELPKLLKDVIVLRELEGLSYDKIADSLHISKGTVRSRIFRARSIIEDKINTNDKILMLHYHDHDLPNISDHEQY